MKKILYIIMILSGIISLTGCLDGLDQFPKTETTSGNVYNKAENYKMVLAKLYASFVLPGQGKGTIDPDISSNSGYDYMRSYFNLQECSTEDIAFTWIEGDNMTGIAYIGWDANDLWVSDFYYRAYYTIALCNELLRNSTDGKISGFTSQEQSDIRSYKLEARFLRALAYSHVLDLYGQGPFVTEENPVGAFIPVAYNSTELYDFITKELMDISEQMSLPSDIEYGRASSGAALSLLAKVQLNAGVYLGTSKYNECLETCKKIIGMGYSIEPQYAKLFNADNHKRTNEIIFPLCVDAAHTSTFGATTYIICGAVSMTSDYMNAEDYGVVSGWSMFRARGELVDLFPEGDTRGMFFTEGQQKYLDVMTNENNGYYVTKWTNLTDEGLAASNTADGVNTDYPMFRLADIYLMAAECVARGASGMSLTEATALINKLRERAYGDNSGNIDESELTPDFILNERGRELYWECTRRTDLIRYGLFTSSSYIWQWKGGVKDGKGVDSKYNIYPIPESDLSANPNLSNKNY